jgi:hypothetical protein
VRQNRREPLPTPQPTPLPASLPGPLPDRVPDRVPDRLPVIAAHLGVKDEVSLIGPCIAHLRAIGVGPILVHDIASTDGTRAWLAAQDDPDLTVIASPDEATDAQMLATTMAGIAGLRADWLVMLDADEFPLPRGGSLARVLAEVTTDPARHTDADGVPDVICVPRYNVVLGPDGEGGRLRMPLPPGPQDYAAIDLFAGTDPGYRKTLEADPMQTWLRFVPLPKVMLRLGPRIEGFELGMHDVRPAPGARLVRARATGIVTAHVALSDYARFAAKVDNIRAMFARHAGTLAPNFGWTWKRWAAQAETGTLRGEFDRSVLSDAEIAELRAAGVIRSVADLLERP